MTNKYTLITENMPHSIFRAYDIRGIVDETLTDDITYTIGLALGSEAKNRGIKSIIVARDGRTSGPKLLQALSYGIQKSGCDVINIGETPTPVLYFATNILDSSSGVMITGSHNPPEYNGIKMVLSGETLAEEAIQKLYQRIKTNDLNFGEGKETCHPNIIEQYIERIVSDVKLTRPLKVVVDCGNGVAGTVAPKLLKLLGCEIIPLFCEVDGNFPNHHPDPAQPENLEDVVKAIKENNADIGVAFDGDADRVGVVTNKGKIISADRLLLYLALDLLTRHKNAIIAYDVKSTSHLAKEIAAHGGKPLMTKTGHSFVKAKIKEVGALLAGEFSGHTFIKERWYGFDDGIYTAVRILELISKDQRSADEIFAALPDSINTPEIKIPVTEENKFVLMEKIIKNLKFDHAKITTIDGVRADFEDGAGFGLIRASNTTPYLIMRFEAKDEAILQRIKNCFKNKLLEIDGSIKLPF